MKSPSTISFATLRSGRLSPYLRFAFEGDNSAGN
jgi:hypothetical protein